jgi:excisionase family DNA binding protein
MATALSPIKRWLRINEACTYAELSRPTITRMLSSLRLRGHDPTGGRRPALIDREELDGLNKASAEPAEDDPPQLAQSSTR